MEEVVSGPYHPSGQRCGRLLKSWTALLTLLSEKTPNTLTVNTQLLTVSQRGPTLSLPSAKESCLSPGKCLPLDPLCSDARSCEGQVPMLQGRSTQRGLPTSGTCQGVCRDLCWSPEFPFNFLLCPTSPSMCKSWVSLHFRPYIWPYQSQFPCGEPRLKQ